MLLILLKSSACLAIFMLFYKLCLEKTSAHTFKRFYLIGAVLISIFIPFITFIEYIEVQPEIFTNNLVLDNNEKFQTVESTSLKEYIPIILWSIYILGASIFAFRFLKNLNNLFQKIKRNPKFKNENTFHVLLQELITPHTFLNYIFLNKTKYENNQIPQEVLLHEKTHANQKHALDIIFIEILQIVFWFNPLLYFIKNDIKLNHEFLADQAVINKGVHTKDYQQLLLAFLSNVSHSSLANAINYSLTRTERSRSIKKRFTIMKTKTSKPTLWLRSFIILPLLAILIYSFSSRDIIKKEHIGITLELDEIRIFIDKDKKAFINKEPVSFKNISNKLVELKNIIIKENSIEPKLLIEVDDHVTDEYFVKIINEIKKTDLIITEFKANSLLLNKKESDPYFKKTILTANYMVFETEKGEIIEGVSIHQNTTYSENKNLKSLLNYLKYKEAYLVEALAKEKKEKDKIEIAQQINSLRTRIIMVKKKLNSLPKKTTQNKSSQLKSKQGESITINIPSNSKITNTQDLQKINNYVNDLIRNKQQKATVEEVEEYNKLAKKFKTNLKGVFKEKDIKRLISIYNLMSKEQKQAAEKMPSFTPPPPVPENATLEQRKKYEQAILNFKELTKDLKVIEITEPKK